MQDSNLRLSPCKEDTLTTELIAPKFCVAKKELPRGIGPRPFPYEGNVLPLYDGSLKVWFGPFPFLFDGRLSPVAFHTSDLTLCYFALDCFKRVFGHF